jgi:hypothetical protein
MKTREWINIEQGMKTEVWKYGEQYHVVTTDMDSNNIIRATFIYFDEASAINKAKQIIGQITMQEYLTI